MWIVFYNCSTMPKWFCSTQKKHLAFQALIAFSITYALRFKTVLSILITFCIMHLSLKLSFDNSQTTLTLAQIIICLLFFKFALSLQVCQIICITTPSTACIFCKLLWIKVAAKVLNFNNDSNQVLIVWMSFLSSSSPFIQTLTVIYITVKFFYSHFSPCQEVGVSHNTAALEQMKSMALIKGSTAVAHWCWDLNPQPSDQ